MKKNSAAITGIGGYLPDYILDNQELSQMVDTSDEWIMSRIGVKTRHILKEAGVGTSYMGIKACENLIAKTGIDPMDVDLVICATVTPDMLFPSTANIIANKTGMCNAFAFDSSAACSGFLFALQTAAAYVESGNCKKVVVVGADKMSSIIDYTDRAVCPIFGDGAGAVLVEANSDGYGIQDSALYSDGSGGVHLYQKAGGSAYPATHETVRKRQHFVHQEGQVVFKAAVSKMAEVAAEVMDRNGLKSDDIKYLVPHQANIRIIDATAKRIGVTKDQCMINIERYGNTTGGTLPLCLWDYESELRPGDNLLFATFGGGFTWGSMYIKWAYDGSKVCKK